MSPIRIETLEDRVLLSTTPNDPSYKNEWGLGAVDAPAAWDTTTGSTSVVVADIDTGLDYTHQDLYLNVWINQSEIPSSVRSTLKDADGDGLITFYDLNSKSNRGKTTDVNKNGRINAGDLLASTKSGGWSDGLDSGKNGYTDDLIGWDFANNDNNPYDHDGHGTHTAGTIAATGNDATGVAGVAWKLSLMGIKIFSDSGNSASDRSIAAAIRYAADNGSRVSSNSWGGTAYSSLIYNAIAYAQNKGHLFVTAAGNDAMNNDSPWYASYPSDYNLANIISVAATTSSGSLANYSNYGAASVDVAAPGSNILSTAPGGDYQSMSGTSMAAPHVTGAVALLLAANPKLTAAQVKSRIVSGADQNASLYGRMVSGGELNIASALAGKTGTRYTPSSGGNTGGGSFYPPPWRRFVFSVRQIDFDLA